MRVSVHVVSAVVAVCLFATVASAQDKQTCNAAYQDAQVAREAHKYVKAREQLRVCASSSCPGFITKDCNDWLKDVDPKIPSVVFVAKNAAGADVTDVKVSMDGSPLADKIDGIAIDVDPGAHTFVFEGADGRAEQKVVVPEGTKAQHVSVTFGASGAAAVVTTTPGVPATPGSSSSASSSSSSASSSGGINALPPDPVDSGLSFSFRLGYALPAGSVDGVNGTSLSDAVSGQVPLWFDVGYLINPYLYVGAYFSYGIATGVTIRTTTGADACSALGVGCSGGDARVGLDIQYRFLGKNKLQPWVGLGLFGYEGASVTATDSNGNTLGGSFSGIEWINPQLGFDYKFLPSISAGPFFGMSLSEFLGISGNENGASASLNIPSHALHEWFYFGVRANYDIHLF